MNDDSIPHFPRILSQYMDRIEAERSVVVPHHLLDNTSDNQINCENNQKTYQSGSIGRSSQYWHRQSDQQPSDFSTFYSDDDDSEPDVQLDHTFNGTEDYSYIHELSTEDRLALEDDEHCHGSGDFTDNNYHDNNEDDYNDGYNDGYEDGYGADDAFGYENQDGYEDGYNYEDGNAYYEDGYGSQDRYEEEDEGHYSQDGYYNQDDYHSSGDQYENDSNNEQIGSDEDYYTESDSGSYHSY